MGVIIILMVLSVLYVLKTDMEYDPKHKDRVTDYLPWVIPMKDGTILNKNGSITRIYKYKCDDMDHQTDKALFLYRHKINDILKRLDEGFVIQVDSVRRKSTDYPKSKFNEKILEELDNSRKQNYLSGKYYESDVYISLTYFPPKDKEDKLKSIFVTSVNGDRLESILEKYELTINEIINLLGEQFIEIEQLTSDEAVSFLYYCISGKTREIKFIENQYLDSYISDVDIKNEFTPKQIGKKYLSVVSILSHIDLHECGLFDDLNRLGIEYRWNNRFIYISNENAIKISEDYQKSYFIGRKSMSKKMEDKALGDEGAIGDSAYFKEMKDQAESLETDTRRGVFKSGYYSFNIVLMDEDEKNLKESVNEITKLINNLGFVAVEETVNLLESYFSTMPGNVEHGLRRPLLTTYNLASLIPITMDWDGNKVNKHLKKEALLFCQSSGNSSFKLNLHRKDVGHTAVLGQTGGGKSVLLNTLAYQAKKYNSRVIIFDKGGSSRVLTRAVGGKFNNIGKDEISFQPLRYIDDEKEKEWALEWILMILREEKVDIKPELKKLIIEGLGNLANNPPEERTITDLMMLIQDTNVKNVLKAYTKDEEVGIYGRYFDNQKDDIKDDNLWQVFEMENIFDSKMLMPVLVYLFHRIETELFPNEDCDPKDVIPTFLFLDECWAVLDDPFFSKTLKSWLKTLRKKQVSVILLTQSLSDIAKSSIKDTIIESCLTKIYLANKEVTPGTEGAKIYENFGFNEREIFLVAEEAEPQRDYYLKGDGGKLIQLALTPLELAYVGASSPEDQSYCEVLYKECNGNLDKFNEEWCKYKNVK